MLAAAAWFVPDRSARLVGLDPDGPAQRYLLRVFAGRAAALGVGVLASSGSARRRWQQLGLLVDVSDTLAGLDPRLTARARALSLITTATYTLVGAAALARPGPPD